VKAFDLLKNWLFLSLVSFLVPIIFTVSHPLLPVCAVCWPLGGLPGLESCPQPDYILSF
jgi:hypothetical protein